MQVIVYKMPDYSKGKIYKIVNVNPTCESDCYVGSTCDELSKRLSSHKTACKLGKVLKGGSLYDNMRKDGADNYRIVVVEEFPCESKIQLLAREECHRYWLKAKYNINKAHIFKEYEKELKEEAKEQKRKAASFEHIEDPFMRRLMIDNYKHDQANLKQKQADEKYMQQYLLKIEQLIKRGNLISKQERKLYGL